MMVAPAEPLATETGLDHGAIKRLARSFARDRWHAQRFLRDARPPLRSFLKDAVASAFHFARIEASRRHLSPEKREAIEAAEFDLLAANCIDSQRIAKPAIAAAHRRLDEARGLQ